MRKVEQSLSALPGAQDPQVNFATHTGQVSGVSAPDVAQALASAGYPARQYERVVNVKGMNCASCVGRVEAIAKAVPGVLSAAANLADMTLRVHTLGGEDGRDLAARLTQAGYAAEAVAAEASGRNDPHDTRAYFLRFLVAAVLTLPVFVVEMGGHAYPPLHHFILQTVGEGTSHAAQLVLTLLVLFGPGWSFFRRGVPGLLRLQPDMDALVVLGTGAALIYSSVVVLAPSLVPATAQSVYFEAACVIVTLILLGRWLEARAKGQTGDAVRELMALTPETALVSGPEGWREVATDQVRTGDMLRVLPGGRIAVDGRVVEGAGSVDEAMLTGEPMPVPKVPGDPLRAGCINGASVLAYRATGTGADTTLARITQMTQRAQAARLPVQELINRVTAWFVPVVIGVAVVTAAAWLWAGSPTQALVAAVSVLIIACPCAMGLATPMSIMVGTGRAAALGVLFRGGAALQALQSVRVVAFDKTGTLTVGRPQLVAQSFGDGVNPSVLDQVAVISSQSDHPISRALAVAGSGDGGMAADVIAAAGTGISGTVEGRRLDIGNAAHMQAHSVALNTPAAQPLAEQIAAWAEEGITPVYVARDGALVAVLGVSDAPKEGAAQMIAGLRARGLRVVMITGDTQASAAHMAARLGIEEVTASVPPGGKADAIETLRAAHGSVAYVGDGINDAPALATADVGIAVAAASDVAIEAADVVLMSQAPAAVLRAHAMSGATLRNIRQNLVWAFGYNVLLIPVAAGVLVPFGGPQLAPTLAAGAMALSSVFVVTNALRLRRAV